MTITKVLVEDARPNTLLWFTFTARQHGGICCSVEQENGQNGGEFRAGNQSNSK
jgi:hypothetical protein